jgi:hypothetical protein
MQHHVFTTAGNAPATSELGRRELLAQLSILTGWAMGTPAAKAQGAEPQQLEREVKAAVLKAFDKAAGKSKACLSSLCADMRLCQKFAYNAHRMLWRLHRRRCCCASPSMMRRRMRLLPGTVALTPLCNSSSAGLRTQGCGVAGTLDSAEAIQLFLFSSAGAICVVTCMHHTLCATTNMWGGQAGH